MHGLTEKELWMLWMLPASLGFTEESCVVVDIGGGPGIAALGPQTASRRMYKPVNSLR